MSDPTADTPKAREPELSVTDVLFSGKFLFLLGAIFLSYANVSAFFGFADYLRTLPIPTADYGILIGALAAVALIIRPIIIPFFHSGNVRFYLFVGTGLAALSLAAYSFADGFLSMLIVRLFHGFSFAVLGTALMTILVAAIPREKSAQFFGYIGIVTLLPNTLVPPLLPFLNAHLGGFVRVLLLFSGLTLMTFPLVFAASRKEEDKKDRSAAGALSRREIVDNLKDARVLKILLSMLLMYGGHALVFFFLDGYGRGMGLAFTGVFLALSTVGEIGVRVVAGSVFDRMDKTRLVGWTLIGLCFSYVLLALAPGKWVFFLLGLGFGIGWGVIMPVFNGLMFDVSQPKFRAFNINLGLQMYQAGFFLGPLIGAPILAGFGYPALYFFCAAMSFLGAALMLWKGAPKDGRNTK